MPKLLRINLSQKLILQFKSFSLWLGLITKHHQTNCLGICPKLEPRLKLKLEPRLKVKYHQKLLLVFPQSKKWYGHVPWQCVN